MKKRILGFTLAIVMMVGFITVPKAASAYVFELYGDYWDVSTGCHVFYKDTVNVDVWNQVTVVRTIGSSICS